MQVYYININEAGLGVNAISLVEAPAVEVDFLKFNKDEAKIQFSADKSKHIVTGVVMLADTPIYRIDPFHGEYWVVFTKDVIEKMVERYSAEGLWNSINLDHDDDKFTNNVILLESYLVNKERGIAPKEFDVPEGSWIASFKVEDDELWKQIEDGQFKGFSLQGLFNLEEKDEIDELIDEIIN